MMVETKDLIQTNVDSIEIEMRLMHRPKADGLASLTTRLGDHQAVEWEECQEWWLSNET
jgi:hypothetical protein